MDRKRTGALIAGRRRELGLTQQELARRLYVSVQAVSKWETGRSFPDVSLLEPLARELGVEVTDLLRGERGEKVPPDAAELVDRALSLAEEGAWRRRRRVLGLFWATAAACVLYVVFMAVCFWDVLAADPRMARWSYEYWMWMVEEYQSPAGSGLAWELSAVLPRLLGLAAVGEALALLFSRRWIGLIRWREVGLALLVGALVNLTFTLGYRLEAEHCRLWMTQMPTAVDGGVLACLTALVWRRDGPGRPCGLPGRRLSFEVCQRLLLALACLLPWMLKGLSFSLDNLRGWPEWLDPLPRLAILLAASVLLARWRSSLGFGAPSRELWVTLAGAGAVVAALCLGPGQIAVNSFSLSMMEPVGTAVPLPLVRTMLVWAAAEGVRELVQYLDNRRAAGGNETITP